MLTWRRSSASRGSTLTEFALVALELFVVMFAVIEFGRMALVYNNVAHAARVGLRYAITHGCDRSGAGADGASGLLMGLNTIAGGCATGNTNDPTGVNICNAVKDYARTGLLNTNLLVCNAAIGGRIQVAWPDAGTLVANAPGSRVQVTVVYPYDPFIALPIKVPLGTTSEGVITF